MGRRRKKEKGKVLASGDLKRTLQSRAGQLRRKALTEGRMVEGGLGREAGR